MKGIQFLGESCSHVYPAVPVKLVLNKHMIENIYNRFIERTQKGDWVNKDNDYATVNDKKHRTLTELTNINECSRIINWNPTNIEDFDNSTGPYLSGNLIFFKKDDFFLTFYCQPFTNQPDPIDDIWVRKIVTFTYGGVEKELNVARDLDYSIIVSDRELIVPFINSNNLIKVRFLYDIPQWTINEKGVRRDYESVPK